MDCDFKPEKERVIRLLNEAGKDVLVLLLSRKIFEHFIKEIQPLLSKTEVDKIFPSGSATFLLEEFEESSLKIIIERDPKKRILTRHDDVRIMRHVIVSQVLPSILNDLLNANKERIKAMKCKPITNQKLEDLCIRTDQLSTFDITLICFLLFELFKTKPTMGFKDLPKKGHKKEGDDVLRIRMYRNMFCHDQAINTSILWNEISSAIIRLAQGSIEIRDKIELIRIECLDQSMKEKYKTIVESWKYEEKHLVDDLKAWTKEKMEQQTEEVKDIIDKHIANSTATIKCAIKKYKEQIEEKFESLIRKYGEQLKTYMSQREGVSGTSGSKIEEILQILQQEMKEHFMDNVEKMEKNIEDKVARNLKESMNNLRDVIDSRNETFLNSIHDSIKDLGEKMKRSQNEVVERNEEMVERYLENFEQKIKTAVEKKEENVEVLTKRTEEMMKRCFQEFEQKRNAKASDAKEKGVSDSECDDSSDETQEPPNKIKITGLHRKVTKNKLKAFFRSKKKSGGGEIEYVDFNKEMMYAIVAFKNPKVVGRVLKKQPFLLEGDAVHAEEYTTDDDTDDSDDDMDKEESSCTLEIRDMAKVLGRQHIVNGIPFQVGECTSTKMYKNKLIIKGLHPSDGNESLTDFFQANGFTSPKEFSYGEEEGVIMVSFEERLVAESAWSTLNSLGDQTLSESLYHEHLGTVHRGGHPRLKLPEAIVVQNLDERKMQKECLETFPSNNFAKVICPEDTKGNLKIELTEEVKPCQIITRTREVDTIRQPKSFIEDEESSSHEKRTTVPEETICNSESCTTMLGDITVNEEGALLNGVSNDENFDKDLSKTEVDKGSFSIQQNCEDKVSKTSNIKEGEIKYRSSGTLNCKMITPEVNQNLNEGHDDEENSTSKTLCTSMKEVNKENYAEYAYDSEAVPDNMEAVLVKDDIAEQTEFEDVMKRFQNSTRKHANPRRKQLKSEDFDRKFRFHEANMLPPPEQFIKINKTYPSKNPSKRGRRNRGAQYEPPVL